MVIAGTGHRPPKLGGYNASAKDALILLAHDWVAAYKPSRVISGGALGWDQALAWGAHYANTPFTLALPFSGFWSKWPKDSQEELEKLVSLADRIHYICEDGYAPWKMQERNKWMVDNCDQVLAMWDGSAGGTGNCIAYANKVNKPIINVYDTWKEKIDGRNSDSDVK